MTKEGMQTVYPDNQRPRPIRWLVASGVALGLGVIEKVTIDNDLATGTLGGVAIASALFAGLEYLDGLYNYSE